MTDDRGTCWSITINNPTEDEYLTALPPGWRLEGQLEKGTEGTVHYQGMLRTPQVRFPAVKRHFPRAHIEIARNIAALQQYVHKDESRVAEIRSNDSLTVFKLQELVIEQWDQKEYEAYFEMEKCDSRAAHLAYADALVRNLIRNGMKGGIEYVAINPMWRSAWKYFGEAMVARKLSNQLI